MLRSILCPTDFSDHADAALRQAVALAARAGAHLTLLTVTDPFLDAAAHASGAAGALNRQTQAELQQLLARTWPTPPADHPPAIACAVGTPHDEILRHAAECEADLIVMGTKGLGGARRLVFGSTTERVLRATRWDVLAIHAGDAPDVAAAEGGEVLVASDVADTAPVARGFAWARWLGTPVRLLHVVPAPALGAVWRDQVMAAQAARRQTAREALDGLGRQHADGVVFDVEVAEGAAADVIGDTARQRASRLVVMGLGSGRHRPGTTAYRVLGGYDRPVLAVASA